MDGLLSLLVLYSIFYSIFKAVKKRAQKPKPKRVVSAFQQKVEAASAETKRRAERAFDPQPMDEIFSQEAAQASTVGEGQSHIVLDADAHGNVQPEYMGSMLVDSDEGECLCGPDLSHNVQEQMATNSVYANEIGREPLLDFSPERLYQGIVMSEILARPTERQRRLR